MGVAVVMSVTARVTEMVGTPAVSGSLRSWAPLPWWGMNLVGEEPGYLALLLSLELSLLLLSGSLLWALLQSGAGARVVGTDTTVGLIFLCWGRGGGPESWTPSPSLLLCLYWGCVFSCGG